MLKNELALMLEQKGFFALIFQSFCNSCLTLASCYRMHDKEKPRKCDQRVREIEHGTFTPLVFSTAGGMGAAATVTYTKDWHLSWPQSTHNRIAVPWDRSDAGSAF